MISCVAFLGGTRGFFIFIFFKELLSIVNTYNGFKEILKEIPLKKSLALGTDLFFILIRRNKAGLSNT